MKHTLGPWRWGPWYGQPPYRQDLLDDSGEVVILEAVEAVYPPDARLIAAAPDMYEALHRVDTDALLMAADELPDTAEPRAAHIRRIVREFRAALSKVEGG